MTETLIKNFTQISKVDTEIAGGKGASLGEMTQADIAVPEGFVILSNAFDRYIEKTDLNVEINAVLNEVDIREIHTVENAAKKIQAMILSREMTEDIKTEILKFYKNLDCKFVAVRSSATSEDSASAAWAGQLNSYLNTTEETLLENIQKCWASLFTPRAIFYRFENKLSKDKISVAVVVQKMVDSEESGIAFSVHPVTQDENQIIIEAGFGLGEAIVSGSITPDSYVIDKQGFSILDINVIEQTKALYKKTKGGNEWKELEGKGKKQVLTEKEIIELSKLIVKIENHYGFPCDIEWAKENGKFYIVQSRPITTLQKTNIKDDIFKKELAKFTSENSSIEHGDGKPVYFEMTMAGFTDRLINNHLKSYNVGASHFFNDELDYISFVEDQNEIGNSIVKDYLKNPSNIKKLYSNWNQKFNEMLKKFELVYNDHYKSKNDNELIELSKEIYNFYREKVSMPGFLDGFMFYAEKRINKLIDEFCKKNKIKNFIEIFTTLTASIEPSFFNEKDVEMLKLSNSKERKKFINKYAWINSGYFGFKPYTLKHLELEKKHAENSELINKKLSENKQEKQKLIKKHKFNKEILAIIEISDLFIKWQDQRKVYTLTYAALRNKILKEISERFQINIKYLEYALTEELEDVLTKKINIEVLKERKNNHLLFIHKKGKLKKIIMGESVSAFFNKINNYNNEGVSELHGTVASTGKAQGIVRIVTTIRNIKKLQIGEILVAPMTRPEHLVGMKKASAIITDDGGITCHAAIVSRELGKPCIIGTKTATKVLKDGDLVEVDANEGIVRVLKK